MLAKLTLGVGFRVNAKELFSSLRNSRLLRIVFSFARLHKIADGLHSTQHFLNVSFSKIAI
jgi:hypothetical protein